MLSSCAKATPDDNVYSLGGDSLQAVKVAVELERHFGVAIPPDLWESALIIRELAEWLVARAKTSAQ